MVITDLEIAQASMELVGGFVSIMLAVIVMINGHREKSMKLLVKMLFVCAGNFAAECFAYIFRGNINTFSLFMTQASNFAVFFLNFLLALYSTDYIYSILQERGIVPSPGYRRVVKYSFGAAGAILVINLFTGWMYYFDAENFYHRGFGWYIYTLLSLTCLVTACVLVIRYRKNISLANRYSLLLLELFPIAAIVIQSLYYGISITNIGIGVSIILVLVTYLIDWNRSANDTQANLTKVRRSAETIVLFVIMVVCVSASIISCIITIRRISGEISRSNSQVIGHIVGDHFENLFLRPVTVTETMSKDVTLRNGLHGSAVKSPEEMQEPISQYLESIRDGFGYQMVYAVSSESGTYYTYNGIAKTMDPENDPADVWYRNFLASGKRYKLELDTDEANNWDLSVFINAQVCNASGELIGVCGVGLDLQTLLEEIERFEEQFHIRITMTDADGIVMLNSDIGKINNETMVQSSLHQANELEFVVEEHEDITVLTKYLPDLDWFLVIENNSPSAVSMTQIIVPNIVIFLAGLFMLAVAFCVIVIRERKISTELIEKRKTSLYDELTGLKNRRAFEQDCQRIKEEGRLKDTIIIMMDVNGLKKVNDTIGHQAGDELLVSTAKCMVQAWQPLGSVYRTGGDEFIALLECSKEQAAAAVKQFDEITANWKGTLIGAITTAKGIVAGVDYPEETMEDLVKLADKLMYQDKDNYYRRTGIDRRR